MHQYASVESYYFSLIKLHSGHGKSNCGQCNAQLPAQSINHGGVNDVCGSVGEAEVEVTLLSSSSAAAQEDGLAASRVWGHSLS